jgi:hypothetical protein
MRSSNTWVPGGSVVVVGAVVAVVVVVEVVVDDVPSVETPNQRKVAIN